MILGVGTDLIENGRVRRALEKFGDRFLRRIYSEHEIEYSLSQKDPVPYLAARFALKEAFIKALGLPRTFSLSYADVHISGNPGKKTISVQGTLRNLLEEKGGKSVQFSISHTREHSVAFVIILSEQDAI